MRGTQQDDPYIAGGLILGLVLFVMYVYPGAMVPMAAHFDGSCKTIPLSASAEDLRIDPTNGLVYLTYYDRADARRGQRPPAPGTVMLVDLNAAEPHVRAALTTEPAGFAPSALSLYTSGTGAKRLFVTSRTELGKHTVEIFEQTPAGAFAPFETIRDPLLWSPTAIVAVGPRQFYIVNQLGFKDAAGKRNPWVRDRMRGNQGSVVYYDGEQMKIVANGLSWASGIAVSPDGRTLYVAESSAGRIQVFDRDLEDGELKPKGRIRVGSAPHNITVDSDGTLWVSAHPHAMPFMEAMRDPADRAPTEILHIVPDASPEKQVEELYLNKGEELSGGSVVAPRGNRQFVAGSGSDHKLLMCTQARASRPAAGEPAKQT